MEKIPTRKEEPKIIKKSMDVLSSAENTEIVPLYGEKIVEVKNGSEVKILKTSELNGCMAIVIIREKSNGKRIVSMSHFPPFMINRQKESISNFAKDSQPEDKYRILIYYETKRNETLNDIEQYLKNKLGSDLHLVTKNYDRGLNRQGAGTLVVKVPPLDKGPVIYTNEIVSENI